MSIPCVPWQQARPFGWTTTSWISELNSVRGTFIFVTLLNWIVAVYMLFLWTQRRIRVTDVFDYIFQRLCCVSLKSLSDGVYKSIGVCHSSKYGEDHRRFCHLTWLKLVLSTQLRVSYFCIGVLVHRGMCIYISCMQIWANFPMCQISKSTSSDYLQWQLYTWKNASSGMWRRVGAVWWVRKSVRR
jgi:hypothetical protein